MALLRLKTSTLLVVFLISNADLRPEAILDDIASSTFQPLTITKRSTQSKDVANSWAKIPEALQKKAKLLPFECGKPFITNSDRIINGKDTLPTEYPWMALLGYKDENKKFFGCGGTLINKRYVLTAAHCKKINGFETTIVRLGEWNINAEVDCQNIDSESICSQSIDVKIDEFIPHDDYGNKNLPSYQNDIALVRLAEDIEFNDSMMPICISPFFVNDPEASYTISGWGISEFTSEEMTTILQKAEASLFSWEECNSLAPAELVPLADTQFCAVGADGENACRYDSGGPLLYFDDNSLTYYQKGVISVATTSECGPEGKPSIFTEVTSYIIWILENLK